MKTTLKLVALGLFMNFSSIAQNPRLQNQNKIEAARIGMITNRLDLTPEQASSFWPVYNEYENKKNEVKKELRNHLAESRSLASTDAKIKEELNQMISLRQKEVDIDRDYLGKFLKVLEPRQVAELYKTEQQFKQMLLRRLDAGRPGTVPPKAASAPEPPLPPSNWNRDTKGPKGLKGPK